MRNLIYQYWIGRVENLAHAGKEVMENYAKSIGAEYRFDQDPTFIRDMYRLEPHLASHMSALRPVFDPEFHEYDNVMYIDCDIFPVEGCSANIFDEDIGDMAVCQEPHMPKLRSTMGGFEDEKWARYVKNLYGKEMPRTEEGLLKVYNSGLVIYSKSGMKKAIDSFTPISGFCSKFKSNFSRPLYYRDQAYVHAMLEVGGMDWRELNSDWNSQLHWKPNTSGKNRPVIDMRTSTTKFVHIQLSGSGEWDMDTANHVVNNKPSEWKISSV